MFTGELAESRQTEVVIRDIDERAMELLIDFAYTSQVGSSVLCHQFKALRSVICCKLNMLSLFFRILIYANKPLTPLNNSIILVILLFITLPKMS